MASPLDSVMGTLPTLERRSARWLAIVLLATTAIAVGDALSPESAFIGLLLVGPLLASVRLGARATALVGLYAVGLAVALGVPPGIFGEGEHAFRVVLVGLGSCIAALVADRRERHEATAMRLAAQYAVARVLAESPRGRDPVPEVLAAVADALEWDFGAVWTTDPGRGRLRCIETWTRGDEGLSAFEELTHRSSVRVGTDLPGHAWSAREPIWAQDARGLRGFQRVEAAAESGLRAGVAVPIESGEGPIGVIELFAREPRQRDPELASALGAAAAQLGDHVERWRVEEAARASEARKGAILETALDCVIVIDHQGRVLEFNPAAEETFGYPREQVLGEEMAELIIPPSFRDPHRRALERVVATGEGRLLDQRLELRAMRSDGSEFPVELAITRIEGPDPPLFAGYLRDITERQRAEAALRESEERFRLIVEGAHDYAIFMLDPEGRVESWNAGAARTTGYMAHEMIGEHYSRLFPPEEIQRGKLDIELGTAAGEGRFEDEGWRIRKDGSRFWANTIATPVRDEAGELKGFVKVIRDVTERKRLAEQLAHQALHDPLTGLPNRTLFLDRVELALGRSRRSGAKVALLFVDLDRFKLINDSLGHAAGDELLVALAERFRKVMRPGDTIARFGGDEFTILCEDVDGDRDAVAIAQRMREAVEAPFTVEEREVYVTASVGIAVGHTDHDTPDSLINDADAAMYRAKELGKGRHEVFDARMQARAVVHLETEAELRRAIERGELRVFYQPQIDLETGAMVGAEALVRWQHPERGLLGPGDFVPLAEETGLIVQVGEVLLLEACSQASRWAAARPDSRPVTVAVNLSATQLAQPDLTAMVDKALTDAGIDPAMLCLEITESVLMSNAPSTITLLLALNGMGVRLAIDDFGTGYSSLGYLRRFPVHLLKIDRSFIGGLGRRADDSAIVAAIVSMGHALGLSVLAEGAETPEQLAELRDLGCDLGQGYLFARPGPPERIEDLFERDFRQAGERVEPPVRRF
jgi:diguanylate cyclase (GGDEF)-like protein/PAS domain S-box-containing protein